MPVPSDRIVARTPRPVGVDLVDQVLHGRQAGQADRLRDAAVADVEPGGVDPGPAREGPTASVVVWTTFALTFVHRRRRRRRRRRWRVGDAQVGRGRAAVGVGDGDVRPTAGRQRQAAGRADGRRDAGDAGGVDRRSTTPWTVSAPVRSTAVGGGPVADVDGAERHAVVARPGQVGDAVGGGQGGGQVHVPVENDADSPPNTAAPVTW